MWLRCALVVVFYGAASIVIFLSYTLQICLTLYLMICRGFKTTIVVFILAVETGLLCISVTLQSDPWNMDRYTD